MPLIYIMGSEEVQFGIVRKTSPHNPQQTRRSTRQIVCEKRNFYYKRIPTNKIHKRLIYNLINTSHIFNVSGGELSLGGSGLAVLAVQDSLSALVHLDLGDHNVGGVDADVDGLTIGLISSASLDVNHVFLSVHSGDLALALLEVAAGDQNLVVLADGEGSHLQSQIQKSAKIITPRYLLGSLFSNSAYVVLLEEVLGQAAAHAAGTVHGGRSEVRLAHLPPGGGLIRVEFHCR